nr:defensin Ec-AMP-D1-like [Lolium perenne]
MDLSLKICMLVVLLLVTSDGQGPVQVALAKECLTQSHKFQGPCVRDSYCGNVCVTEPGRPGAFIGGKCVRVHDHGCFCIKKC